MEDGSGPAGGARRPDGRGGADRRRAAGPAGRADGRGGADRRGAGRGGPAGRAGGRGGGGAGSAAGGADEFDGVLQVRAHGVSPGILHLGEILGVLARERTGRILRPHVREQ